MGLPIVGSATFREDLIKCLWKTQRHQGEIPGLSFEDYLDRFNKARESLRQSRGSDNG